MRLQAHFLAADFAAPRVVAVWSSVAEFQALAIRFTANVLFPGTLWVALLLLIDLVVLKMVLFGNGLVPRGHSLFATSIPLRQSVMLPSHLGFGGQPSLGHILWTPYL